MNRIVLVSNRVADLGKPAQAGGVVTAIADILSTRRGVWFGWNGKVGEKREELRTTPDVSEVGSATVATLALSRREYKAYYLGYANDVLWPVFHSRLDVAQFEAGY
jgi:trehalose 6-phosphate synthase